MDGFMEPVLLLLGLCVGLKKLYYQAQEASWEALELGAWC